ncbi:MAG: translation initiation factor IF-2 [Bacteroidales bacterium]
MIEQKGTRLSKLAKELNVGISTIVDFLKKRGHHIDPNPNTKVSPEVVALLEKEFSSAMALKKESEKISLNLLHEKKQSISINDIETSQDETEEETEEEPPVISLRPKEKIELKVLGKIDLNKPRVKPETDTAPATKKTEEPSKPEPVAETQPEQPKEEIVKPKVKIEPPKVVGKIDLTPPTTETPAKIAKKTETAKTAETPVEETPSESLNTEPPVQTEEDQVIRVKVEKLSGPKVVGKIDLPDEKEKEKENKKLVLSSSDLDDRFGKKKKRKRIKIELSKVPVSQDQQQADKPKEKTIEVKLRKDKKKTKKVFRQEIDEEEVQKQIKETLARLTSKGKTKAAKYRREKREEIRERLQAELEQQEKEKSILRVTEFVTANELATMMNIPVTQLISTCMSIGLFVSINQRLDAETISLLAEEYNYKVEFVSAELQEAIEDEEDNPEDLQPRPPIVTVMGHVDHGKTKLLDFIRNTNVVAGEAGGITQHIGAYSVTLDDGRQITFLDTPGHEAFTAMRARGAKITDVAVIVVAADDGVKPQTKEAINHALAAGVPIVFAINKIDLPTANPDRVREELAQMNILVEEWGGKYQTQEISAKTGLNVDKLLEKVLLEAEMLDLKANPNRRAKGTVIESSLDKGRGYVATVLVSTGTLRVGDLVLAGTSWGKVKAMFNERNKRIEAAGPSTPVLILGLNGAPQAGDEFHVLTDEKEAKEIALKREQLQREQELRTRKHITLDEIGRRIAIGNFKELNIIVKGDVDGSVEALSDSLIKLSTEEIQVNIIHKAVGQISESDVLLAAASNAIIIGFQVRPSMNARKLAEKEQIEIRLYSIIYDAIEDLKDAMEGMLSPIIKEEIVATLEVLEIFKISKVGTVAGCMCREGKIQRNSKVRVIRDGIVVYSGELGSLKRFKDDVKEVVAGQDCGLTIENFNDIKVGDVIEAYVETEVKKRL